MITRRLTFGKSDRDQTIEIVDGELLRDAVSRVLKDVPMGDFKEDEVFIAVVNGMLIDKDFWAVTKLSEKDIVLVSPAIKQGESGQIFKQLLIITVTIIANTLLPGSGTVLHAIGVAAFTVGASLLLNALIPPPVPNLGNIEGGGVEASQMFRITGQSNEMRRLGNVPKVYGSHRMFPSLAAVPYTELSVDPTTGESVQYLYAIYDFGLGVMNVSELKIGDTPLTTDSFRDFDVRLVDPMGPVTPADEFDKKTEREFKFYRGSRSVTPLSLNTVNGNEYIQNSDSNTEGNPQEIILDFIAQSGLFGYSSGGTIGDRNVRLEIHFALVGTSTWMAYNDVNFVDSYSSIAGTDVTDFQATLAAEAVLTSTYYTEAEHYFGWFGTDTVTVPLGYNVVLEGRVKVGTNKLLVLDDTKYEIGAKVHYGNRFLGVITAITPVVGPNTELTLDRVVVGANDPNLIAYYVGARSAYSGGFSVVYERATPSDFKKLAISRHETSVSIVTGNSQSPVYAQIRFHPKVAGQYKIRVKRTNTYGTYSTQVSDDLTWGALTTAYMTSPVQSTKRHCFLELRIKATDQLNGNIQNLSGVISSIVNVYDPETETWTRQFSNNPAWIFVDLLTGEVNKKAVPVSRIHLESILEWAEYCDEVPDSPPSADYKNPRFQCNFILDYDATLQSVLGQVSGAAQASLNLVDGKYGVLIDSLKETPVQIFTPRNSKDFSSTRLYGPRPHALKIKYIDPSLNWEITEAIAYDNGYTKENATDLEDMTSFGCTNNEQAWRFGRYMIAQNKLRQETISLLVDFENLVCTRGDYVQITQDVMRVGGTPARVKDVSGTIITIDDSIDIIPGIDYGYVYRSATGEINTSTLTPLTPKTFDVDGDIPAIGDLIVIGEVGSTVYDCIVKAISPNDDMSANLVLIEKADAIFDYESTDTLPDYDPQISTTSRPDFYPPLAVTNLIASDNFWECSDTRSGYNFFVELIWDVPAGSVYELFEIWVNDGRGYKSFATSTSKFFRYNVAQTRLDHEHGFKVVAVSASGKKLQLVAMPEVLVTPEPKTTPPSDIDALNMSITDQVLNLSWDSISDCDVFQYVIRFSPDPNDTWESSVSLATVAKTVNSLAVQARTGVYLIKAIDYAGNQSVGAARALTTIPNLFDLNVIETLNDAPDFDGTLDQVVLLGEAVILDEAVSGDVNTVQYYAEGFYTSVDLLDLDDVYTVRLQSQIRADGFGFGELMSEWDHLDEVDHLNTATSDDWDVDVQYRATDVFAAMSDWAHLSEVDHLNYGAGIGFTDWRPIPTIGDATGRIFQFRTRLRSLKANVTPRLFDATIKADMPDRTDSFENLTSSASAGTIVTYEQVFKGPGTTPNVQVSIDNAQTGDYWSFDYKALDGLSIRFYDKLGVQVVRQFDLVAKGFGRRHTVTI